jgi:hypothetical protein
MLPFSQERATGRYSDSYDSSPQPLVIFPKIHFNIILPSIPRSSEWALSLRVYTQKKCVRMYHVHACALHFPPPL